MLRASALMSLVALAAGAAVAEPAALSWETDLERGLQAAEKSGKPVLIYVFDSV